MTLTWMAVIALAGLVASFAGAAIGIGGGLLVMPILSLWLPPARAVAWTAPMFFASTAVNFWRYRGTVVWRTAWLLIPGVVVGQTMGTHFLAREAPSALRLVMGGLALLFATHQGLRLVTRRPFTPMRRALALPLTVVAGLASALTNIGGTVVSFALMGEQLSPNVFVGTLNAIMVVMGGTKLALFGAAGLLTGSGLVACLPSIPAILLGSFLGRLLNQRLRPMVFRWGLVAVIGTSAVVLLVRA